jgi:hypothetical protein
VAFYTISNERFFPGTVCLVNSLRLTGNAGEIVVLDLGLSRSQRELLSPHATLVEMPEELGDHPTLYKAFPHLLDPDGIVVIIDGDMIVTRSLDPLMDLAEQGKVCLFSDIEEQRSRWFEEWQQIFGLSRPLRRQDYLNAGFVAFSTEHLPELLRRYWECCEQIPAEQTMGRGGDYFGPFWGGDQDALNALLMSEVSQEAIVGLPEEEGPSADLLTEVRVLDERTLACTLRGGRPYLLHYWGGPKPWEPRAWMRVRRNAYVQLMPRLLFKTDVPIAIPPDDLPGWLRPGLGHGLELRVLSAVNGAARGVLRLLSGRTRGRLRRLRGRLIG